MKTYFSLWVRLKNDLLHTTTGRMAMLLALFLTIHSLAKDYIAVQYTLGSMGLSTEETVEFISSIIVGYIGHLALSLGSIIVALALIFIPVAIVLYVVRKRNRGKDEVVDG